MSRILDYVLEPSVVYTNGSFLVKVKVQDDYKYKKLLVSENMKYTTATGKTFTLTNAVSTNNASILQLEGNTTQNGTPTPSNPIPIYTVSGDNEVLVRGKNLIPTNVNDWESGHYDTNGNKAGYATRIRLKELLPIKPSTTYYYNSNNIGIIVRTYDRTRKFIRSVGIINTNTTFTPNANEYYLGISIDRKLDTYVENTDKLFFCYNSQTDKTWEAYTGNSYRVDFGGKNLLKITGETRTINGVTFTQNSDGSISVRGTATANAFYTSTTLQQIEPNRLMKLSGCPNGGSTSTYRLILRVRSNTTTNITTISNTGGGANIPQYANAHYILGEIYVYSGQTVDLTFYPQVEYVNSSSDPATEYSPYVSNPIQLNKIGNYVDSIKKSSGKNLFDKDNVQAGYYINTNTGVPYANAVWDTSYLIKVEPNTSYTISNGGSNGQLMIAQYKGNEQTQANFITYTQTSNGATNTLTITTNELCEYIIVGHRNDRGQTNIMLNEGSTALPYEPYGNSWYIEKNIGKVVLNGTENWAINRNGTANWYYYANISSITIITDSTSSNTLCDHYTWGSVGVSNTNTGYYIVKNGGQVRIRYGAEDTVANYKTWLGNNNVTLYYQLANPTYEIIDNENLIQQLNNIQNIELIENLCYVDWVGEEKPDMTLQYPTNETLNAYITTEDNKLIRTDWGV